MRIRSTLLMLSATGLGLVGCGQPQNAEQQMGGDVQILASTESSRDFGDYVVHFNAVNTDRLTPEIAREYSIVRSPSRALLNISMQRKLDGGATSAIAGAVAASAVNLNGQVKNLLVREIREQEAIYYIAEMPISNAETLIFTVDVTPQNEANAFTVRFEKQFFVD